MPQGAWRYLAKCTCKRQLVWHRHSCLCFSKVQRLRFPACTRENTASLAETRRAQGEYQFLRRPEPHQHRQELSVPHRLGR
jgi:hypothetical protein